MASLSAGIYTLESPVAGWELVKFWKYDVKDTDAVGIYRKKLNGTDSPDTCVLTFTGTDSLGDVWTDVFIGSTNFCGFDGVHEGFAAAAEQYMQGEREKEFMWYLRNKCQGGRYIAGHSMGGALANLVAACVNRKVFEGKYASHGAGFDGIYTIAAPGVSKKPLTDFLSRDGSGCFQGGRFFNHDEVDLDPIPPLAGKFRFKQPALTAIRIKVQDGVASYISKECNAENANTLQDPVYKLWSLVHAVDFSLHGVSKYISRMLLHIPGQGGD